MAVEAKESSSGGSGLMVVGVVIVVVVSMWLTSSAPATDPLATNTPAGNELGGEPTNNPSSTGGGDAGTPSGTGTTPGPIIKKVILDNWQFAGKETAAATEYLSITADYTNTAPVNITGWKVASAISGETYSIPGGVKLYYSGQVGAVAPVILSPGDTVILSTGRSPVGESFLINKCSRYLSEHQKFYPSISGRCPLPSKELPYSIENERTYGVGCAEYIEGMPQCKIAPAGSIPANLSPQCHNFIATRLTYNGCVTAHKNDSDFYKTEWRLFLGREKEIWRNTHEEIQLIDASGTVVSTASY